MRILVIGQSGQVARSLMERAGSLHGIETITAGRTQIDLEDARSVGEGIARVKPDLVVNAAAYTAVDKAEEDIERAFAVNGDGAGFAAAGAARLGVPFIQLSTDYVFSGEKPEPYSESDDTDPLSVYGKSKRLGEQRVLDAHPSPLILRTSWLFSPFGVNFVRTMLRLGAERPLLRVVDDQWGNPTSALDLASAILRIAPGLQHGGTYHLCGSTHATWCSFARGIFDASRLLGGPSAHVEAITSSDYPTAARRPANSRLSTNAFSTRFGFELGSWQSDVRDVVSRLMPDGHFFGVNPGANRDRQITAGSPDSMRRDVVA